jgi:hypothetical protein
MNLLIDGFFFQVMHLDAETEMMSQCVVLLGFVMGQNHYLVIYGINQVLKLQLLILTESIVGIYISSL